MLRQLWRLSRNLEIEGKPMSAPAIYAEYHGRAWHVEQARESGYEGVACVDDAARLSVLLLRAYERYRLPWALEWARGNLEFVLYLQQSDGNFVNFILDWQGHPNTTGPTSRPGGTPWLARALWALATAYRVTGESRYMERYEAALSVLPEDIDHADILAGVVFSLIEFHGARPNPGRLDLMEQLCGRIYNCRRDGLLLNHEQESVPHLWGYVQPAALCRSARILDAPEWIRVARETVMQRLAPVVEGGFPLRRVMPYEVSSTVLNCDALYEATEDTRFADLAAQARMWFHGRNSVSAAVYNQELGMVFDGIDGDQVNVNSGAESNIEGGLALFEELPWREYTLP